MKVHSMAFSGLLGGGSSNSNEQTGTYVNEDGKQVIEGYEVADVEDMEWLASIL